MDIHKNARSCPAAAQRRKSLSCGSGSWAVSWPRSGTWRILERGHCLVFAQCLLEPSGMAEGVRVNVL